MDNSAQVRDTEDQLVAMIVPWARSKQLMALQYLRILTRMEGRMDDLPHEIGKALRTEKADEGKT